jgi:hypothetical protein
MFIQPFHVSHLSSSFISIFSKKVQEMSEERRKDMERG